MCIVFMICELFASSLRIRSSKSLSDCDCANSGRQSSVAIKPEFSPENQSVIKQRDYIGNAPPERSDDVGFGVAWVIRDPTKSLSHSHLSEVACVAKA